MDIIISIVTYQCLIHFSGTSFLGKSETVLHVFFKTISFMEIFSTDIAHSWLGWGREPREAMLARAHRITEVGRVALLAQIVSGGF